MLSRTLSWAVPAAALLAVGAATTVADASVRTKVAILTGTQETPPVTTAAAGCATMQVNTDTNVVTYRIAFSGLTGAETAAHFHGPAGPGASAPPVHTLPAGNPKVGAWTYPEAMEPDVLAGNIYINIHSVGFGGGEIRGQVVDMAARLDGAQAGTPSAGSGYGLFNIDTVNDRLHYHIVFGGLTGVETAAHIHGFSTHVGGAGILHPLAAGSPKTGTWSYAPAQEPRILNGETYVNIHTSAFGGGEIRGQVVRLVVPFDGSQEVPPVASPGHGCGCFAHDDAANTLSYHVTHQDLTGPATAAHIHGFAAPGASAGVKHGIGAATPAIGAWAYPAADEAGLLAGLTYVNVHTAMHGGGEVRGQIVFPETPCPNDLDCDGTIGFSDLLSVLTDWGAYGPCPPHKATDIDRDCTVGFSDLLNVLTNWGPCP